MAKRQGGTLLALCAWVVLVFFTRTALANKAEGVKEQAFSISVRTTLNASSQCQILNAQGYIQKLNFFQCPVAAQTFSNKNSHDSDAKQVFQTLKVASQYFYQKFGMKSYDNRESEIKAIVRVKHNGSMYVNDRKLGKYIVVGEGNPEKGFQNSANYPEVIAHEYSHMVIDSLSQLGFEGDAGAIQEAFADYFAIMMFKTDWRIGNELYSKYPGMGRDLQNPKSLKNPLTKRPYPAHMNDSVRVSGDCTRSNDFCGVHINTTIWGHALYLIHKQVGQEKAEKIFFHSLKSLGQLMSFNIAAHSVVNTCESLYSKNICQQVASAFKNVGINPENNDRTPTEIFSTKRR